MPSEGPNSNWGHMISCWDDLHPESLSVVGLASEEVVVRRLAENMVAITSRSHRHELG